MRYRDIIGVIATSLLFLISAPTVAQDQQQDRDQDRQVDRDQTMDQDRTMDRDRIADRTMDKDMDRDQDRDQDQDRDRDRDRDRIHQDQEIYGGNLMTEQERNQYRERLQNASSKEEQKRIQAEHQNMIQERARQQGVKLPPPPPESE